MQRDDLRMDDERSDQWVVDNYAAWCRLTTSTRTDTPEGEAWEYVQYDDSEDWDEQLDRVRRIAGILGRDEAALSSLGASVLEDLFAACDDSRFARLAEAARADPLLAIALRSVWRFNSPQRRQLDALLTELGIEHR